MNPPSKFRKYEMKPHKKKKKPHPILEAMETALRKIAQAGKPEKKKQT
jgi:hypothetical protein